MSEKHDGARAYEFLKEIAILNQLATAELNRALPDGLHVSHFTIIEHLKQRGTGQTPQDLARVFQMSKQNMTNSIAQLQKRGLIKVDPNPNDGRSKIATLTAAGHAFREKAIEQLSPLLEEISELSSFQDLDDALPAFQALRVYLDSRRD